MQTEVERLASILRASNDGNTVVQWDEVARNALASGLILLPPAPVDPAWFEDAVTVILRNMVPANYTVANPISIEEENTRRSLRALLAAGYRVIPPTQDRAAVIEKALEVVTRAQKSEGWWKRVVEALYNAGMLVEGDGR